MRRVLPILGVGLLTLAGCHNPEPLAPTDGPLFAEECLPPAPVDILDVNQDRITALTVYASETFTLLSYSKWDVYTYVWQLTSDGMTKEIGQGPTLEDYAIDTPGEYVITLFGTVPDPCPGNAGQVAVTVLPAPVLEVTIDIKPGSDPNSVNLGSNGGVPVAIFSTADFDATTVDPATVKLADAAVRVVGKGKIMAHEEDVDGDGLVDLVVQVDTQGLDLTDGDVVAELMGETYGGTEVHGTDTIRVVP